MLSDVLRSTQRWSSCFIVTSDTDAVAVGRDFGCSVIPDPGGGLNEAIESGTASAIAAGTRKLLVLASDLPLVNADDIAAMFSVEEQVAIAPSGDGGTNALLRQPPAVIPPAFGPNSAEAHKTLARKKGVSARVIEMRSMVLDIDRYEDLVTLAGLSSPLESVRLAQELLG